MALAAVSLETLKGKAEDRPGIAVGNRAHISVSPKVKDKLIWCFRDILGCGSPISMQAPGIEEPILAFRFPGGGAISIEFTEAALDEQLARRGAWLEIRCEAPDILKQKVLGAGLPQVTYPATNTFYFAAPGGQVFGVVSSRDPSAGELKTK
jgi:hypothetical protein